METANKKLIIISSFFILIIALSIIYFRSGIIERKYRSLYEGYRAEPAVSTKETFEVDHSLLYYYIGEDGKLNVKQLIEDIDLKLNFISENEEVVRIDANGNIRTLKEGRATIVVENGYDDYTIIELIVVDPEVETIDEAKKNEYEAHKDEIKEKEEAKPSPNPSSSPVPTEEVENTPSEEEPQVSPSPTPTSTPEEQENIVSNNGVLPGRGPASSSSSPSGSTGVPNSVISSNSGPSVIPANQFETNVTGYTNDTYTIGYLPSKDSKDSIVSYVSSDNTVLTVDNEGKVKYLSAGNATVTITNSSGISKKVYFNVISRERIHFISQVEAKGKNHDTGDAILLESNGHYAMIDLGNPNEASYKNVVNYLKNNGVTTLDFLLFTHMDSDHAGNLQHILEAGIHIKNIWMKNYDVDNYRRNYIPNMSNGIDVGNGQQNAYNNDNLALNKALARYKRIVYLAEYSKYKDQIDRIRYISNSPEGTKFDFIYLKFTMTLYNNTRNINASNGENWNSVISLIEVNNHKVLLTGDAYDTKQLNEVAAKVGKVDVFKLPHHGSRKCALLSRRYNGNKYVTNGGVLIRTNALYNLKPQFFIITSSKKKLNNIRTEYNVEDGAMCVDLITSYSDNYKYYADEARNAVIVDLTISNINIESK